MSLEKPHGTVDRNGGPQCSVQVTYLPSILAGIELMNGRAIDLLDLPSTREALKLLEKS